jgi:predicted GTPase
VWWVLIPVAIAGAVIVAALADGASADAPSILEQNLRKLRDLLSARRGPKIALLGQPGAGKSSLLDRLTDGRCVPRPVIGTTTDATDWSKSPDVTLLHEFGTMVFVDTPGYDTEKHPVKSYLDLFPFDAFDSIILVLSSKVHQADDEMLQVLDRRVSEGKLPASKLFLVRCFADTLSPDEEAAVERDLRSRLPHCGGSSFWLVSNRTGRGIAALRKALFGSDLHAPPISHGGRTPAASDLRLG